MKRDDFIIKQTKRDWVIINHALDTHSHFRTRQGCEMLLDMVLGGRMPSKPYFVTAAQRILTEKQFKELRVKRIKQKYINR